jgi:hypothetical protein
LAEGSATLSLFEWDYREDSVFYATPPHLPIHYEWYASLEKAVQNPRQGLSGYDALYAFHASPSTHYHMPSTFPPEEAVGLAPGQHAQTTTITTDGQASYNDSNHPGAPWLRWREGCGQPGLTVIDQDQTIQCPFVRYAVYNGILFMLGTEGVGQKQFAKLLYAESPNEEELPVDAESDLDLLVRDVPFNFALEQALDTLGDPGVLAEVAHLRTLAAHVPIYSGLTQAVQELSEAIHKFQKAFSDQTGKMVIQLEATKKQMQAAWITERVQAAIVDLSRAGRLQGQFYWPHILDMPEDPG